MHPKSRMFNKLYNRVKVDVLLERVGIETKRAPLATKGSRNKRTSQYAPREEEKKINKLKPYSPKSLLNMYLRLTGLMFSSAIDTAEGSIWDLNRRAAADLKNNNIKVSLGSA